MPKRTKKAAKSSESQPEAAAVPESTSAAEMPAAAEVPAAAQVPAPTTGIEDPVGDTTDGEAHAYFGDESARLGEGEESISDKLAKRLSESEEAVSELQSQIEAEAETGEESEFAGEEAPPAHLERLQKILSQAGIASRRRAEEMITEGRVQVNGAVVTELGSKADPARDHIRVDGKLLHGAERHRYFVLNKPRGYVTTVSDPEGRPTVMQFFEKMRERLYPVGRLDYQSEGLLLVTNDGELANQLTKAGSGVEKTYLVKVAGQPSEEELDRLRGGVAIERDKPGSGKVHTAPARVRQVRQGDNPWFEVVLIEGRNRELRKMFSAVGHFVEKIRRVGYGPLELDLEPGKLRELRPEEVEALRLAAEGKLSKKAQRRLEGGAQFKGLPQRGGLPPKPAKTRSGTRSAARPAKPFRTREFEKEPRRFGERDSRPREPREDRRDDRAEKRFDKPFENRAGNRRAGGGGFGKRVDNRFGGRPDEFRPGGKPNRGGRPQGESRPAWEKRSGTGRPQGGRSFSGGRDRADRRFAGDSEPRERRPRESGPIERGPSVRASRDWAPRDRAPRAESGAFAPDRGGRDRRNREGAGGGRPPFNRSRSDREGGGRPQQGRTGFGRPGFGSSRAGAGEPKGGGKPSRPEQRGSFRPAGKPRRDSRPSFGSSRTGAGEPGRPARGKSFQGGNKSREFKGKAGGAKRGNFQRGNKRGG